jgi:hypothetical protein
LNGASSVGKGFRAFCTQAIAAAILYTLLYILPV